MEKTPSDKLDLPKKLRVSLGSAITLGLLEGKLDAAPTTAYLMTYKEGKCTANCSFCPQARTSQSKAELLSRVTWPTFSTQSVLKGIENAANARQVKRICIQALNYPDVFRHISELVKAIKQHVNVPVSVSCQPLNAENIKLLAGAGVDRIGIPLDAATERLFSQVKGANANGPYTWNNQFKQLQEAIDIFGKGNVSTHIIVGLGETEKDAIALTQKCIDMGVLPALFAFTPVRGTKLETKLQPRITTYRRVQLARYLIANDVVRYETMIFNAKGQVVNFNVKEEMLQRIVESGKPFLTSGCPECNRPFYNEKPSGPLYNYPRDLQPQEKAAIVEQLHQFEG